MLESMPWAENFKCLNSGGHLPHSPWVFVRMKGKQDLRGRILTAQLKV